MSPEIATQMVGYTSAAQVWTAIHEMFSAQNRASIRHICLQLQTLKKGDMPVDEYFRRMKALVDSLASVGHPLSTVELIDYIIVGLGPLYGPLAASLTLANKSVSLTDFYAFILSYEAMQEQHASSDSWSSTANAAARHTSYGPRQSRSDHAKSDGDHHNRQHGQPLNRGRSNSTHHRNGGRGHNGGNRFRPRCQICRVFGHEALHCTIASMNRIPLMMDDPQTPPLPLSPPSHNGTWTPAPLII